MSPPTVAERPTTALTPLSPGRYVIDNNSPPWERIITDTGVQLTRASWERSEVVEGEPEQCRWTQRVESTWRRGEWRCALEASYELSSTPSTFFVAETLIASSGGLEIFRRTHTSQIARELM